MQENNKDTFEQDFRIQDIFQTLRAAWKWLAWGAAVGLVGSSVFLMLVPARYEAKAVIQPATVGLNASSTTLKGIEIESAAQTLERLKLATFYNDQLLKVCNVEMGSDAREQLAKEMKPILIKGNSLIQVVYRSSSPEIAMACLSAVVDNLAKAQASIANPIIKTIEEQRVLTKQQLEESHRFQSQIEKRAMSLDPSDAKFSQTMLMLNAALSKREEITKLQKTYNEQSLSLSQPLTEEAKFFEPIYASDAPVFPKKSLTFLGGLVLGVVLGGLAWVVRRFFSKNNIDCGLSE